MLWYSEGFIRILILYCCILQYFYSNIMIKSYISHFKRFKFRNVHITRSFRQFSSMPTDQLTPQKVKLKDGSEGILMGKAKGWYSLAVGGKIIKARASEFDIVTELIPPISMITEQPLSNSAAISPISSASVDPSSDFAGSRISIPTIPALPLHDQCKNWLIFSDLHVKPTTIDVCEEFLQRLDEESVKKDAGIIFLGDFWHVRGTVSVELLNRVLKSLNKWTQPVIMIPGNHDQVTLGGNIHGVEPLKYAFRPEQALIIDDPSVYMGALWMPYRRNQELMGNILKQSSSRSDISMIFCHADVQGAWMNDGIQSRDGIDVSMFPPNLPIYSGHFHKPHTIEKNSRILRYVGSPYQTSLSEADQEKYLYRMTVDKIPNTDHSLNNESPSFRYLWKESERWPISIGKKYYKLHSLEEPRLQELLSTATQPIDNVPEVSATNSKEDPNLVKSSLPLSTIQSGDRIVLTLPPSQLYKGEEIANQLRKNGIEVDLREENLRLKKNEKGELILSDSDNLSNEQQQIKEDLIKSMQHHDYSFDQSDPITIFKQFLADLDFDHFLQTKQLIRKNDSQPLSSTISPNFNSSFENLTNSSMNYDHPIVKMGLELIEKQSNSQAVVNPLTTERKDLVLQTVSLSNFGPYGPRPTIYPLDKRGLVLIRGQIVSDGHGADSNGSGKTTLAMSILWCLTGSLDTRLISDLRTAEVINDASYDVTRDHSALSSKKHAEVIIKGNINQKPFEIIRRKYEKKQELFFQFNHENLTAQSVKATQMKIDEVLGIGTGLLQRCYFFGQHSHTHQSLLGLSDTKLKEELSTLINNQLWITLSQEIRQLEKSLIQENIDYKSSLRQNEENRWKIMKNLEETKVSMTNYEIELATIRQQLAQEQQRRQEAQIASGSLSAANNNAIVSSEQLENQIAFYQKELLSLEKKRQELQMNLIQPIQKEYDDLIHQMTSMKRPSSFSRPSSNSTTRGSHPSSISSISSNLSPQEKELEELKSKLSYENGIIQQTEKLLSSLNLKISNETKKLQQLEQSINATIMGNKNISAFFSVQKKKKQDIPNEIEILKKLLEDKITSLGSFGEQISSIKLSLQHLELFHLQQQRKNSGTDSSSSLSSSSSSRLLKKNQSTSEQTPHNHHQSNHNSAPIIENCPTCGQNMISLETALQREKLLTNQLQQLNSSQSQLQQEILSLRQLIQSYSNLSNAINEFNEKEINVKEILEKEKQQQQEVLENTMKSIHEILTPKITQLEKEISLQQEALMNKTITLKQQLQQYQNDIQQIDYQIKQLSSQKQSTEYSLNHYLQQFQSYQLNIEILKNKIAFLQENYQKLNQSIEECNEKDKNYQEFMTKNQEKIDYYEKLLILFSTKGIQQYIFQFFLFSLENYTNYYLSYLTDNSMKLFLIADLSQSFDRILKLIKIRSTIPSSHSPLSSSLGLPMISPLKRKGKKITGDEAHNHSTSPPPIAPLPMSHYEWKERHLSQLSGGQWRRCSLALDFAFTKLIRQRGLLRCNVLVLDEILTHLDARGRESVGSLLKSMVHDEDEVLSDLSTGNTDGDNWLAKDPYDTILVILQDLAAMELEEAFDHMDVVVKEGDIARIELDGEKQ